jgi:hypothetical protein
MPTFSWSSVAGAGHYSLVVIDTSAKNNVAVYNPNVIGISYTLSTKQALTPGHNYVWYIGSVSTNGQATTYDLATPQTFSLAALGPPTPTSPSGTINTTAPTFIWTAVIGADHYAIYLVDTTTNKPVVYIPNINDTSFTPSTSLRSGHSYMWYTATVSANGTFFWSSVTVLHVS